MASLIEDLAREMKSVKSDAFSSKRESMKIDPLEAKCIERCEQAHQAMEQLKRDLDNAKNQVILYSLKCIGLTCGYIYVYH